MSRALAALLAVATAGCDSAGDSPATRIDEPRILAVRAEPPVVEPSGSARIEVLAVGPDGRRTDPPISMRACYPWRPLLAPDVDCAAERSLEIAGDTLAIADVLEAFPPPAGAIEALIAGLDGGRCPASFAAVEIPIVVEAEIDGVRQLVTKSLRVAVGGLPAPRRNPRIDALVFDGELTPPGAELEFTAGVGHRISARLALEAADPVCDGDLPGAIELERFDVNLYSTAGRFDDREIAIELAADGRVAAGETGWSATDAADVSLWLIATDGDGGVDWADFRLVGRR